MKKLILSAGLLLSTLAYSQTGNVGINTANPAATLDVTGTPATATVLDGIIAPRSTGTQLSAKTYTTAQTGALVYATAAAAAADITANSQVTNVTAAGYYYFDGTLWQVMKGGSSSGTQTDDWHTTGNTSTAPGTTATPGTNFVGTTDAQDLAFRTANKERLRITQTGRLDLSNTSPVTGAAVTMATNIFVEGGNETTTGSNNTAVGTNALLANTSGVANVALGSSALKANTSGGSNVALGYRALIANTTGSSNISMGDNSLQLNTTGKFNIAIGHSNLNRPTTSDGNVAIGMNASTNSTVGNYNTFLGYYAGQGSTFGDKNVLLGYTAGEGATAIGNRNIIIGPYTRLADNANNSLNIGWGIFGTNLLDNENFPNPTGTESPTGMRTEIDVADGKIGIMTPTPNSTLQVAGSVSMPIRTIPDAYYGDTAGGLAGIPETTINPYDYKIILRNTGTTNLLLPDPTTCKGRMYVVQSMFDTADVIFDRDVEIGGAVIITAGTAALTYMASSSTYSAGFAITLQSDGTVWTGITQ